MATLDLNVSQHSKIEKMIRAYYTVDDIPTSDQRGISAFRARAWDAFNSLSLPSTKNETWKRVDFSKIPLDNLPKTTNSEATGGFGYETANLEKIRATGMFLGSIKDALKQHPAIIEKAFSQLIDPGQDLFAALPAAISEAGLFLYIPEGLNVKEPIHLKLTSNHANAILFNHLVWLEKGAQARITLEDALGEGDDDASLVIGNMGIHLGKDARLLFVDSQLSTSQAWRIRHDKAILQSGSQLEWLALALEGQFTKHFMRVDLAGQGSTAKMAGMYLTSKLQQVELNTYQNHLVPNTTSDLIYKGVLLDESRSLFSGMIRVSPGAFKTDGYQVNRNLIIGSGAHADTIPGLEIMADDVRCTHGATVGKIDPTELFYLQSRGLNNQEAQRLIIQGYLDPIIQRLPNYNDRFSIQQKIDKKLESQRKDY